MSAFSLRTTSRCAALFNPLMLALAGVTGAHAQSLADSPVIFRSGQWSVHRTTDAMTDATVCTGIYKDQYNVQLSANSLTILVADGVKKVTLRFDDEDPKPSRPASESERKKSAIGISAGDFSELLDSKRLRYEVVTESNSTVSGDINLDGVFLVHGNVTAGCAGNPIATPPRAVADACSQPMRERMSGKGLSQKDINDICGNPG